MAHRIDIADLHDGSTGGSARMHEGSQGGLDGASRESHARTIAGHDVLFCGSVDPSPRWRPGERLHHLFEDAADRFGGLAAVVTSDATLTYAELDRRANQVARHLIARGVAAGDRVGLLFDKTIETYVALVAALKAGATYVPLDPGLPAERIRYMLGDAKIRTIVSMASFSERLAAQDAAAVLLDTDRAEIDARSPDRLFAGEAGETDDPGCYVIYTSGTTGNPKGVLVEHPSICNFVRIAAARYGYRPGDRVYQGMTIAFDFSIEETWVPLMAGATLVPARAGGGLVGEELADFLHERRVTAMCCCPTLLSTIERDLPHLRLLMVGGEACPQNLVMRWSRRGRTILNTYGPTEATVTATVTELVPEKPVTIGIPMPTYSIVILDPAEPRTVARGELGEIGIAGIGVAAGYLNREELTAQKFIPDFVGIPNNASKRIYRTGDLGRINDAGEIEYLGRIDTQVKIRGYRIELVEIESVMMELPQIAQAAVSTFEPEPGLPELVGYYALKPGAGALSGGDILQALKRRLPAYMVPAYLEQLDAIPMSASNKADRKRLPKPTGPRCQPGGSGKVVAARTDNERLLVEAIAEILTVERVSIEDNFFDDLGANSLLMARFCARIRRNPGMESVSMRDIYANPTIARLAATFEESGAAAAVETAPEPFHTPSDFSYYACGAAQLLFYGAYSLFGLWVFDTGLEWTYAATGPVDLYVRSVAAAVAGFFGLTAVSILGKWLLVGRFSEERIPIWSARYFRFWAAKTLMRNAPVALFAGHPIFNVYLRLLGARIGRNTIVKTRFVPVATDLISIGDDTVLRKETILLGYRAQSNYIHTGRVSIGDRAFVGEASVLDIDTAMGNDTQLGHASSLQSGQRVPDGRRFHGSPAVETTADYVRVEAVPSTALRRGLSEVVQLAGLFALVIPAPIVALALWEQSSATAASGFWTSLPTVLVVSLVSFFGSIVTGLAGVWAVPRLARLFLKEGRTYSNYGLHAWLQGLTEKFSNSQFFNVLFGDASAIVHYMRFVGWNLNTVEQTGSNMGTNQKHDNPFCCEIGSGTMVSDGLSMINLEMSASSFRLCHTRIGDNNYLGNNIHYPPGGRTGANVLLGTKVMIPIDGPVQENVGLLGSPPFAIPRMVERDKSMLGAIPEDERLRRLAAKNRYNAVTAALFLATRWLLVFASLAVWQAALLTYDSFGVLALFVAGAVTSAGAVLWFTLMERASLGFGALKPQMVTIYDPYFWSHERHWKLSDWPHVQLFGGTPVKSLILQMMGVKVGRKVVDFGCSITDRSLTEVGDFANLNEGSVLQAHSLEEGVFKSDLIRMGAGCTLGPSAFVHYGVTLGDHVVIDTDAFLMKGEVVDAHTTWRGNPAKLFRRHGTPDGALGAAVYRAPEAVAPAWRIAAE
ncbi:amino acid adenylation domain-containing protein [Rhodoplanes sp. TEM]|uniref:Amino acid adenylation domain-containing protein n=1 Tax=Rhodoplanes tepidamans TaxID=200616 RepID=A0ABT5J735_RHOTP|nr:MULTISPECIES: Pls/PosA family non-ribosomal peptide synthetase [Rhodoplanes]MDC7784835.1 amino acid adenylation domain-containing protein [Rhodoplanes tepidamans]MDC7982302.1 amino acid adenylation domain-containing protein [Rhodoplanes sp. TEM]MDQ0356310.1 non-ribosomal peptide synthetase-like protein [Rhodoplanes tepidamans]